MTTMPRAAKVTPSVSRAWVPMARSTSLRSKPAWMEARSEAVVRLVNSSMRRGRSPMRVESSGTESSASSDRNPR